MLRRPEAHDLACGGPHPGLRSNCGVELSAVPQLVLVTVVPRVELARLPRRDDRAVRRLVREVREVEHLAVGHARAGGGEVHDGPGRRLPDRVRVAPHGEAGDVEGRGPRREPHRLGDRVPDVAHVERAPLGLGRRLPAGAGHLHEPGHRGPQRGVDGGVLAAGLLQPPVPAAPRAPEDPEDVQVEVALHLVDDLQHAERVEGAPRDERAEQVPVHAA
mmetsp:Transcript_94697/g.268081  ORF Transcript_94697/g.268081 Transcript_94697/m.268081 type:complete len:218 (-) Transcript_94697:2006-2659(-)